MADDVTLPATGAVAATDEVGGRHFQRVKMVWGADGVAADVNDAAPMPVGIATQYNTLNVGGDRAHDATDVGDPVKIGFRAVGTMPARVSTDDRSAGVSDLWGRQLTAHIDPNTAVHKAVNVTTTQTGSDVWSPASGLHIAVTSVIIASYGTTAARVILWFGDNADTTYTAGTDQVLVAASFAPSATAKPGLVFTPMTPVFCTTADRELHLTTDAGISLDITVEGYEW